MSHVRTLLQSVVAVLVFGPLSMADEFDGFVHTYYFENTGTFGRGVVLDFTDDPELDAAFIHNGRAEVMADLAFHQAQGGPYAYANDLAVLSDFTTAGPQALLIVNATGLQRCWFERAGSVTHVDTLATGAWSGASHVRSDDLDGVHGCDVIGLASDRRTFLRLNRQSDGSFASGTGFSLASPTVVEQFELVEWDGDAAPEVAIRTASSLMIRELNGSSVSTYNLGSATTIAVSVLRKDTLATERVAVLARANNVDFVQVYQQSGSLGRTNLALGGQVTAGASGDYDGDGDDDLFLTTTSDVEMIEIDTTSGFALGSSLTFLVWGAAGAGAPPVTLGDVDHDYDLDVMLACVDWLRVFKGETHDETDFMPEFSVTASTYPPSIDDDVVLHMAFGRPIKVPPTANHLEVTVWVRQDGFIDADPISVELYALEGVDVFETSVDLSEVQEGLMATPVVLFYEVRLVTYDATLVKITEAWPATIIAIGGNESTVEELVELPGAGAAVSILVGEIWPSGSPGGVPEPTCFPHPTIPPHP